MFSFNLTFAYILDQIVKIVLKFDPQFHVAKTKSQKSYRETNKKATTYRLVLSAPPIVENGTNDREIKRMRAVQDEAAYAGRGHPG